MNMMESIIVILVSVLLILNVLLFLKFKKEPKKEDDNDLIKIKEDIGGLKESLNESFSNMSKEVAKDMTGALTKVDEKVGVFNRQVSELNKSQDNFSKILSGVKTYGTLAEFGLGALLTDLLPASQFIANVKMKEESNDKRKLMKKWDCKINIIYQHIRSVRSYFIREYNLYES